MLKVYLFTEVRSFASLRMAGNENRHRAIKTIESQAVAEVDEQVRIVSGSRVGARDDRRGDSQCQRKNRPISEDCRFPSRLTYGVKKHPRE